MLRLLVPQEGVYYMLVSHTQLATFRRCPREFAFRYNLGRMPLGTAAALSTGRKVHGAIGAHLRGEDWETEASPMSPGGRVPRALDPIQRAMMIGYVTRWKNEGYTIERTDVPFVYPIGEVTCPEVIKLARLRTEHKRDCVLCGGLGTVPVEVQGEIDAVGFETARPDEKAIFEHKTTSEDITPGSAYWRKVLQVDAQVSTYLRAGETMGYKKVIYDVLRKPALKQKQKETPDQFVARIIEDMAERPEYYFQRATVIRLEGEREDFVKDVLGTTRLMMVGEYPRNVDSCFKWNRPCEFFSVCTGEVDINDDARFQTRERKPQPQPTKAPSGGRVEEPGSGEAQDSPAAPGTIRSPEGGKKYVFGGDA